MTLGELNLVDIFTMAASTKSERANAKRSLTLKYSHVKRLIVEDKFDSLPEEKSAIIALFSTFEAIHVSYHNALTDDEEILKSEDYFIKEQDCYANILKQIKDCLNTSVNNPVQSSASNQSIPPVTDSGNFDKLLTALNRPKVTIKKFSGNCKEFYSFLKCFDLNIDSVCDDPEFKLTCLLENTSGHPHEMIESCVFMSKNEGYKTARKRLEDKYGDKNLIAIKILEDVARGKPVKTADELSKLAVDLENAKIILKEIGMISAISTQFAVQDIVSRLPNYLKNKFCDKTVQANEDSGAYLDFEALCAFIHSASKKASDSLFGETFRKKKTFSSSVSNATTLQTSDASAYNSSVGASNSRYAPGQYSGNTRKNPGKSQGSFSRSELPCILCSQSHRLWHCPVFREKSPRERLDIVNRYKLCHNCFLGSHTTVSCGKQTTCFVKSCNAKHSMWIHVDGVNSEMSNASVLMPASITNENPQNLSNASTSANAPVNPTNTSPESPVLANLTSACTAGRAAVYMPICKVIVNGNYHALAMLDSASSNTFCTKSLRDKLELSGTQVQYTLDTLSGTRHEKSEMVSMSVSSLEGDNNIHVKSD